MSDHGHEERVIVPITQHYIYADGTVASKVVGYQQVVTRRLPAMDTGTAANDAAPAAPEERVAVEKTG